MTPEELTTKLSEQFSNQGMNFQVDRGDAVATLPLEKLEAMLKVLKEKTEFDFDFLMDLTAVDWQDREARFDVVYHLYSTSCNHRLRIKVMVEANQSVPSSAQLWKIADCLEREVWDMYGIKFSAHPKLTRLLLYEEFKGHPLRKDYQYDKRQPIIEQTWPSKDTQVKMDERGIHRP